MFGSIINETIEGVSNALKQACSRDAPQGRGGNQDRSRCRPDYASFHSDAKNIRMRYVRAQYRNSMQCGRVHSLPYSGAAEESLYRQTSFM